MVITSANFDSICRICISKSSKLTLIHDESDFSDNKKLISEVMMACCNLQIFPDDNLPQHICNACLQQLRTHFMYKELCEQSDEILKAILHKENTAEETVMKIDLETQLLKSEGCDVLENTIKLEPEEKEAEPEPEENEAELEPEEKEADLEPEEKEAEPVEKKAEIKTLECEHCKETFQTKRELTLHLKRHKNPLLPFCFKCTRVFPSFTALKAHVQQHLKCPMCKKTFSAKQSLLNHIRRHTGEKPHSCKDCGLRFGDRSNLMIHVRTHKNTKQGYECDVCHRLFFNRLSLGSHRKVHKYDRGLKCETCNVEFKIYEELLKHDCLQKEKVFKCGVCEKSFAKNEHLIVHKASHSNGIFECEICGKKYTRHSDFWCHVNVHLLDK